VSYLPDEKVLFGGCQVKAMGAGRGNVADANTVLWPVQAKAIKAAYPEAEIIVPGHGSLGKHALLDFTAELFSEN
jgi:metallo-beta-lactamase class B